MDESGVIGVLLGGMMLYFLVMMAFCVFTIICQWKVFTKAGKPGWASIIPYYNIYQQFDIVYGDGWKCLLLLIPLYNIVVLVQYSLNLAKAYGQSTLFGLGLLFLSPIFYALLAFKKDISYIGPCQA